MRGYRVLSTAAFVFAAQMLSLAPASAVERVEIDPAQVEVDVEPRDVETTREEAADGSLVIGGYRGTKVGCAGVQAYVEKRLDDGSLAWALSASADKDCDLDGLPDGGGAPMFENMTTLDPQFIVSSTVHDSITAADGSVFFTGQLLVAWLDNAELTTVWGGYVIQQSAGGQHLADIFIGPQPTGSPVELADCVALCLALSQTTHTQWGGRALVEITAAHGPNPPGLVLAGWEWTAGDGAESVKDVFFLHLDPGLKTAQWFLEAPYPGSDLPLDLAIGSGGELYATGYFGPDRDVFVTRIDGETGALTHLFVGGGVLDDWGDMVTVLATGEVEVEGTFTDSATFGNQVLLGEGPTRFRALLTPTLELILAEVPGSSESLVAGSSRDEAFTEDLITKDLFTKDLFAKDLLPPPANNSVEGNVPTNVDVLVGYAGSGTQASLVSQSDNEYLVLYGEPEPDHDKVEVVFEIPITLGASLLDSVEIEFRSEQCTLLEVLVGGGDAADNVYYALGEVPVCPFEEPTLAFGIPESVATALGFSATMQSSSPIEALLTMEVHGTPPVPCSSICPSSPGEDESVDELTVNSEYP